MDRHSCQVLALALMQLVCCPQLATGVELQRRSIASLNCGHPDNKEVCFEQTVKSKLVYTEFEPVVIRCVVRNLGKHVVTWMKNDGQDIPLTIGKTVFTPDKRVKIDYSSPDEWNLVIQGAEIKDSGEYLCQVNSKGHLEEKVFQLIVKESDTGSSKSPRRSEANIASIEQSVPEKLPKSLQNDEAAVNTETAKGLKNVNIFGPKIVFRGKQFVSLTCTAVFRTRDAKQNAEASVEWYHQGLRQRSSASSMDISMSWKDGDTAVSVLTIYSVQLDDAGDWICLKRPSERNGLETASHHLTVLERDPAQRAGTEAQQQQHQQRQANQQYQQYQLDQAETSDRSSSSSLSASNQGGVSAQPSALAASLAMATLFVARTSNC